MTQKTRLEIGMQAKLDLISSCNFIEDVYVFNVINVVLCVDAN